MFERIRPPARTAGSQAPWRTGPALALVSGVVGLAAGSAWLGSAVAETSANRLRAERIDQVAIAGFSDEAISAATGGLDLSALAIARRHDPYLTSGDILRERQAEHLAARLEQASQSATSVAVRPFSLSGGASNRDLECLTQAAYYEARGEGRDGMRAVTQVVLNRVRHAAFPKTICGVVFEGASRRVGCQFSFTCNGTMRAAINRSAWSRARDVAQAALDGDVFTPVGTATHFHTTAVSPGWRTRLTRVGQVGQHLFYRFGDRGGVRQTFNAAPERSETPRARVVQADLTPAAPAGPVAYLSVVEPQATSTAAAPMPSPVAQPPVVGEATSSPTSAAA